MASRSREKDLRRGRSILIQHFPAWLIVMAIVFLILPQLLLGALGITLDVISAIPQAVSSLFQGQSSIAPLFTEPVAYWSRDIDRWAAEYDLDPNLLATVMQIESCGHPTVSSSAGAQGLFQVMPFHFGSTEDQLDPNTNAMRGAGVLQDCLARANNDAGLAMACYNGGPSVLSKPYASWNAEPQRYYRWGTGIYADARNNSTSSATLEAWLAAGGTSLCERASTALGIAN